MKDRRDIYVYIVIMIISLVVIGNTLTFKHELAKVFPIIMAGGMFILALSGLIIQIVKQPPVSMMISETDKNTIPARNLYKYLQICAWLVLFLASIYIFGFIISIFVFMVFYMKTHGRKWLSSILVAALTTVIIYGTFVVLLQTELFEGILFGGRV